MRQSFWVDPGLHHGTWEVVRAEQGWLQETPGCFLGVEHLLLTRDPW